MLSQPKLSFLQKSELFESLSQSESIRLASMFEPVDAPKHHLLFAQGAPNQAIYFVEKGSIRVSKHSPDRKSFVILALLGPGDLLGDAAWLEERHDCSAETLEESQLLQLSCQDLEKFVRSNPSFALQLMPILGQRLKQAQNRIEDLVFRQVPSRIAKLFISLADSHGRMTPSGIILDFPLTHQEIADIVGSSRVTVTQVLNRFRSHCWVSMKSKRVSIHNISALEELVASDANPKRRSKDSEDGERAADCLRSTLAKRNNKLRSNISAKY